MISKEWGNWEAGGKTQTITAQTGVKENGDAIVLPLHSVKTP
jgi:hypothetical protein